MKPLNQIVADLEYCKELKFRVYDHNFKKMLVVSDACFIDGRIIGAKGINWDSRVTVIQYTGRKDKNGVEIYEGDIVESAPTFKGVRWVIEYRTDSEFVGYVPVEIGKKESHMSRFVNWNDLKVIGNVYENPDLLKNNIISLEEVNKNI